MNARVLALAGLLVACQVGAPPAGHRPSETPPDASAPAAVDAPVPDAAGPMDAPAEVVPAPTGDPDGYWLERIGVGPAQTRRVCDRQRGDPVARALCSGAPVASLRDLHRLLGVGPGVGTVSIATNSSGLSFQTISVVNPRVFLTSALDAAVQGKDMLVVAFARGEQLVELTAYDPDAAELNFYLLAYRQACNATRCTPEDLLSPRTESNWASWTLYAEADLEDTPLDCLSCHQPEGPGTKRRLLMRDFPQPWFHWLPSEEHRPCPPQSGATPRTSPHQLPDLRADFERLHPGGYGGLDLQATRISDGHNLHSLLSLFGGPPRSPRRDEPFVMDALTVVDQWRCFEQRQAWDAYRAATLEARGLPVPYYRFDVLDRAGAAAALADPPTFLRANRERPSFGLLRDLLSDDARLAIGAVTDGRAPAEAILRQACSRCHDRRAPAGSHRAKFNVDSLSAAAAVLAIERIGLPADSPMVMPPRRAGTLSPEAHARVTAQLKLLAR